MLKINFTCKRTYHWFNFISIFIHILFNSLPEIVFYSFSVLYCSHAMHSNVFFFLFRDRVSPFHFSFFYFNWNTEMFLFALLIVWVYQLSENQNRCHSDKLCIAFNLWNFFFFFHSCLHLQIERKPIDEWQNEKKRTKKKLSLMSALPRHKILNRREYKVSQYKSMFCIISLIRYFLCCWFYWCWTVVNRLFTAEIWYRIWWMLLPSLGYKTIMYARWTIKCMSLQQKIFIFILYFMKIDEKQSWKRKKRK